MNEQNEADIKFNNSIQDTKEKKVRRRIISTENKINKTPRIKMKRITNTEKTTFHQ